MPVTSVQENPKPTNVPAKRRRVVVVVAGLALVAALVVWFVVVPSQKTVVTVITDADKLAQKGNTSDAIKVLNNRLSHTLLGKDRYQLELALGVEYTGGSRYDEAIKSLQAAVGAGGETPAVDVAYANLYVAKGDTATAKKYYQKLIDYYQGQPKGQSNDGEYYKSLLNGVNQ